eukprot:2122445-Rhodomonas_salina.2
MDNGAAGRLPPEYGTQVEHDSYGHTRSIQSERTACAYYVIVRSLAPLYCDTYEKIRLVAAVGTSAKIAFQYEYTCTQACHGRSKYQELHPLSGS